LGLGVAIIVGVAVLASASGAATTKAQKVTRIDVSTRAAVVHYLRSINVNARHAVIQRGLRNYAGARCPGTRWTCARTRHTVVQIAKPGGQNRFMCRSSHCVVVQISGTEHGVYMAGRQGAAAPTKPSGNNTAACVKTGSGATTGTGQSCAISQTGSGLNTAGVYENTQKISGLTQTAQYTASITQVSTGTTTSTGNKACVTQNINLDGSGSNTNTKTTTADLQAHQSVLIKQDALNAPNSAQYGADSTGACNTSVMTQSQTLTSTVTAGGPIVQNQDTKYSPCGDAVPGDYANLCLKIDQNQTVGYTKCTGTAGVDQVCPATGANTAIFTQNSTQAAVANSTKGAAVTQQQSNPLCGTSGTPTPPSDCVIPGGLVGTINQDSGGVSIATPTQNETQCADADRSGLTAANCLPNPTAPDSPNIPGGLKQTQYGPVGIGKVGPNNQGPVHFSHFKGLGQAHQAGNGGDQYTINQNSTQNADTGALQLNHGEADCKTDGSCTAGQTTTINGGTPTQDGYTSNDIQNLIIDCPTNGPCKATPPPVPTLTGSPPLDDNGQTGSTSATFEFTDKASDAQFVCTLDGVVQPTPHCGSPSVINKLADGTQTYTGLGLGPHTFQVQAVDKSGNLSDPTTVFNWTVVPPCSAGVGNTRAAYNAIPIDIATCPAASEGFEADADNEFGAAVTLDTTAGTSLQSMMVDFQSWGCETGHWYSGDCASTPGHGFTIPGGITAKIYSDVGGVLGSVIATSTVNPTIPYRPSADNASCTGTDAGKWFDSVAGVCRNGYSASVTFSNWTFPHGAHTFTSGEEVVWTVQYNTSHAGYNPIGESTACFGSSGGCGYDSLNVGSMTFPNAPYAGSDVNTDVAFLSSGGPLAPLSAQTGWASYRPLGEIVLGPGT
jgi:hypothetical protein